MTQPLLRTRDHDERVPSQETSPRPEAQIRSDSVKTDLDSAAGPNSTRALVLSRDGSELEVSYVVHRHNNLPITSRFFVAFCRDIVMHASGLVVILATCWLAHDPSRPAQVL